MKKIIDDTLSTFGIVFLLLIMWSLLTNSTYMFNKNSLLIALLSLFLILMGNYMRYRKRQTK